MVAVLVFLLHFSNVSQFVVGTTSLWPWTVMVFVPAMASCIR